MKTPIFFALTLLAIVVCFFTKHNVTLFPYRIPPSVPFHPEWEISSLSSSERRQIFSQTYTYLGKGDQCVAFESQDHQYVLKFPYHSHRLPPSWFRFLPVFGEKYRRKLTRSVHKKLSKDAHSLLLAFTQWKEETGLIAMHWNRTSTLRRKITTIDDANQTHTINLDTVAFSVQKKAQLIYPALEQWMLAGRADLAKEGLSRLVTFFHQRDAKGIEDPEQCLEGNFGFLGTRPMQIDFGHLTTCQHPRDPEMEQEKIWRLLLPLKERLDISYPELGNHLALCLQNTRS